MVYAAEELLALAEGKLIEPVNRGALLTNSGVVLVDRGRVPGFEAAVAVVGVCELVIAVDVEAMPGGLGQGNLDGVEVGVLVVSVVGDALRPTAGTGRQSDVGIDCWGIVWVAAGC